MIQKISIQLKLLGIILNSFASSSTLTSYIKLNYSNRFSQLFVALFFIFFSFHASAQQDHESLDKLFNRAYHYLSVDKNKAIDLLNQCIEQDSTFVNAFYHRGITFFKLGKYELALADFEKAQDLSPDQSIIWMYKGFTYRNLGEADRALDCFSNYISENPTDTSAYSYILRGKVKYELGDFEGAVNDYDLALKLEPFEEKYQYYRFVSLFEAKAYSRALKAVDRLLEINPDFYGYYFYKGNVLYEMSNYESAVDMYNIAVIKNYQNADSYYKRAEAYFELKEYHKSIEDYNTAIVLKSNDGTFYSGRGNSKYALGMKHEACEDWNEAGGLGYYEDFDKMKQVCESLNISKKQEDQ